MNDPMLIELAGHPAVACAFSWSEIAESAYRAYAASTGNKNFRGDLMPAFEDLPQPIRTAWEAAVRQVVDCLRVTTFGTAMPDHSRWAGWVPPSLA